MKTAVFPGSFDPFTNAHLDLVKRGLLIFDEIIVAIGVNSSKKGMLSITEKTKGIQGLFKEEPRVSVASFQGLTVTFCQEKEAPFILRGLRNAQDFEFENMIAENNKLLYPEIETVFLISNFTMGHISSTIVRDIWRHRGDVSHLIPKPILDTLPEHT
ncbi:MAG TPA: pantetheine-phosphate adenylyltransferase [Sphingobacterium sp.]|nr:pantetheine-phosphate adenylyltransferase [Sphingobacterium sp.]